VEAQRGGHGVIHRTALDEALLQAGDDVDLADEEPRQVDDS
jgi:hypothetical protein